MRDIINTDKAPKAIGPYSQAIRIDCVKLLFCSGQIAVDPKTGETIGKTAAEQCKQVMQNVNGLLQAAGTDFSKVVKTTIFLVDMNDFASVNDVYGAYFESAPPARSTVAVSCLPKDVKIEIEVIATL